MYRSLRARKVLTLVLVLVFVSMVCVPAAAETEVSQEATEVPALESVTPVAISEPSSEEATPAVEELLAPRAESSAWVIAASAYVDAFEDDDSAAQARMVTPGVPQSHTIHVFGDEDWVKIDVEAGVRYRFETQPGDLGFDTEIYLYASDTTTVLGSDDNSGAGSTFSVIDFRPTTAETVYLRIIANDNLTSGAYRLSVTGVSIAADAYEIDNDMASAGTIVIDGPAQQRTFHVTSDDDWVRVDLVAGQEYIFQTHPGDLGLDTYLHLYDSDGVEKEYDDDTGADYYSIIRYTATASGTYYLKARPYGYSDTGVYQLTASTTEAVITGDAYEIDDTPASAKPITTDGVHQVRSLHIEDDLDYVSFAAQAGVTYQIETHEVVADGLDTEMYVYDSDGTSQLAYDDDGGVRYMSYIELEAEETETLYVLVHPYDLDETGQYSLTVLALTPDAYEVDDTPAEAKQITPGAAQTRTLHRALDEDWVRLDVIAGLKYTIDTRPGGASMDTVLYLFDAAASSELDNDGDSGPGNFSHLEYEAVESTTLYISVIGSTMGGYTLAVECDDLTPPVTTSDALSSYNVSGTISLAASDPAPGVGVAATYYVLDGAAKQVYAGPITVGAAGAHTLQFWSVDRVTNAETAKSVTFQVIAPPARRTISAARSTGTTTASAETTTAASVTATPTPVQASAGEEPGDGSGEVELTTTSAGELGEESDDASQAPFLGWTLVALLLLLMLGGVAAFARKKK